MLKFMLELVSFVNCFVTDGKYTTISVFMAKVFQKDGKINRKNLSQKKVLKVLVTKFRIRSAFPE
jgi:hypothetical protein